MKKRNFLALASLILLNSCCPLAAPASTTKTSTAANPETVLKENTEVSPPGEDILMATSLALQVAMFDGEEADIAGLTLAFNQAIESQISFRLVLEESHLDRQNVVETFEKLSTLHPHSQELARYLDMFRNLRDSEKNRLP